MLAAYLTTAMALTVATSIFIKTMLTGLGVTWVPPTWRFTPLSRP